MMKVNCYSVQVKYSGRYEDYTMDALFNMALAKMHSGVDCYDTTLELSESEAKKLDGQVFIENTFPSNKIATVRWAYIDEL